MTASPGAIRETPATRRCQHQTPCGDAARSRSGDRLSQDRFRPAGPWPELELSDRCPARAIAGSLVKPLSLEAESRAFWRMRWRMTQHDALAGRRSCGSRFRLVADPGAQPAFLGRPCSACSPRVSASSAPDRRRSVYDRPVAEIYSCFLVADGDAGALLGASSSTARCSLARRGAVAHAIRRGRSGCSSTSCKRRCFSAVGASCCWAARCWWPTGSWRTPPGTTCPAGPLPGGLHLHPGRHGRDALPAVGAFLPRRLETALVAS